MKYTILNAENIVIGFGECAAEDIDLQVVPEGCTLIKTKDAPTDLSRKWTHDKGKFIDVGLMHEPTYADLRRMEYPDIRDQLDALWKGGSEAVAMKEQILAIKAKHPKP